MPAHPDTHEDANGKEIDEGAGSPITEKWKGDSHHRHDADNHADVNDDLPEKHGCDSYCHNFPKPVSGISRHLQAPDNKDEEKKDDNQGTYKPPFLRENGKDKIGMMFREEFQFTLGSLEKSLSP